MITDSSAATSRRNDHSTGKTATSASSLNNSNIFDVDGDVDVDVEERNTAVVSRQEVQDNGMKYDPGDFLENCKDDAVFSSVRCQDEEQGKEGTKRSSSDDNTIEYHPNYFSKKYEDKDILGSVPRLDQDQEWEEGNDRSFKNSARTRSWLKKSRMSKTTLTDFTLQCSAAQSQRQGVTNFSADCYSFMTVNSPFENPFLFFFGFMVFTFQTMFLCYMVLSMINPRLTNKDATDNPSNTTWAIIPANVTPLIRWTQITSIFSYCIFADSSLMDCITAVEQFPRSDRVKKEDKAWLMRLSCSLRFFQGFLAVVATMMLIITGESVVEIILNFAAVNYISTLDEVAFELAMHGKYGPYLEQEAKSIIKRPLPNCMYRKYHHQRYLFTMVPITLSLLVCLSVVVYGQESSDIWVTKILRVQFHDSAGLRDYNGCYEIVKGITHSNRRNYNGNEDNEKPGVIRYCIQERRWNLFKKNNGSTNPCDPMHEGLLAYSATTNDYDVSGSFDKTWYSASGTPLDLHFVNSEDSGASLHPLCGIFLNNGHCDALFNDAGYQYDEGDCCASTCIPSNCGVKGLTKAFGVSTTGDGFPNCIDPTMVSLTIHLNSITSSRNKEVLSVTDDQIEEYYRDRGIAFWTETPVTPFFIVDCDGVNVMAIYVDNTMENKSETIMVEDGAMCRISVSNTTSFDAKWNNDPIWWVNYTVYHGNDTTNEIISGYSGDAESIDFHQLPQCYFEKLKNSIDVSTAYVTNDESTNALAWLAADQSGYSSCEDEFFIERFALSAVNFAAPINTTNDPSTEEDDSLWISTEQQCHWENLGCSEGSIEILAVRSKDLIGTISSAVGLLSGLRRMGYDNNGLTGTIPSEIGLLINLKGLDITNNKLTGTIPTEFGKLVSMVELDLDTNKLRGTIPTEFGLMSNAKEFDLIYNELTGNIPTEIGKCYSMSTFAVTGNKLTGPIPSEMGNMKNIEGLMLINNIISGTIPNEIKHAGTMRDLSLSNNRITGTIPPEIGKLTKLEKLALDMNKLTGSIPSEVGSMTSLTMIDFHGNHLRGKIPTELGLLTNLREIRLEGNAVTGSIPSEILLLQQLLTFTFNEGELTGMIPSNIRTLASCNVCQGQSRYYRLKPAHNNENEVFLENGVDGNVGFSCRSLLQMKWDKTAMSSNACKALEDTCIYCDDNGYYHEDVHVPAIAKQAASGNNIGWEKADVAVAAADTTEHELTDVAGNTHDTESHVVDAAATTTEQGQTIVWKYELEI